MSVRRVNFPLPPRLSDVWQDGSKALDRWLQSFRDYVQAQPRTRFEEIDFTAPAIPITLTDITQRPFGVELLALWSVDARGGLTAKTPNAPLSWAFSDGSISLPSLAGLTPSGKYRAVVRITEGVG